MCPSCRVWPGERTTHHHIGQVTFGQLPRVRQFLTGQQGGGYASRPAKGWLHDADLQHEIADDAAQRRPSTSQAHQARDPALHGCRHKGAVHGGFVVQSCAARLLIRRHQGLHRRHGPAPEASTNGCTNGSCAGGQTNPGAYACRRHGRCAVGHAVERPAQPVSFRLRFLRWLVVELGACPYPLPFLIRVYEAGDTALYEPLAPCRRRLGDLGVAK